MFICEFGKHISKDGEPERLIVTQWRAKTYPQIKLPALPGTNTSRWSRPGKGYEAAEVKRCCRSCPAQNAPFPNDSFVGPGTPIQLVPSVLA